MHMAKLRRVGGSVMVALPPAMLQELALEAQAMVGVGLKDGRIVIDPHPPKRYSLTELLAACDPAAAPPDGSPDEPDDWASDAAVGEELL